MKLFIIALTSQVMGTALSQSSYCSFSSSHIMCKNPVGVSNYCGEYYYRGLTRAEKQEALGHHNKLRSRLAVGSTNHPAASNMMELEWDDELAVLAQRHADQCEFVHDCSDCRRVSRFRVGQNLLRDKSPSYDKPDWSFAIESWFREIVDFPNTDNTATYRFIPGTGHFAQMMWAQTSNVGCGVITYRNRETSPKIARYYVCHYGPVGNFIGQQIYRPGRSCSSCPVYTRCSQNYPGLCSGNQGFTGNITRSRVEARTRVETPVRRVPRIQTDFTRNSLNTINTQKQTQETKPRVSSVPSSVQNRNGGGARNIIQTNNAVQDRNGIQSRNFRNSRFQSRNYVTQNQQNSQCSNIVCRIFSFFS